MAVEWRDEQWFPREVDGETIIWVYMAGPILGPGAKDDLGRPSGAWAARVIDRLREIWASDQSLPKGFVVSFLFPGEAIPEYARGAMGGRGTERIWHPVEQSDLLVGYLCGSECARAVAEITWAMGAIGPELAVAEVLDPDVDKDESRYAFLRDAVDSYGGRRLCMEDRNLDAVAEMVHAAIVGVIELMLDEQAA